MTPRKLVRLYCDKPGCVRMRTWQLPLSLQGNGLHLARENAARGGWTYDEQDFADYCPTHG